MNGLRTVSLYTGAGGMDYGLEAAGFHTRVAVEFDADCCDTLRANRDWPIIERDIHDTTSSEILRRARLRRGHVDLLTGGPPCQPFSKSGYWVNGDALRMSDPRAATLQAYMRCVGDLLPTVFLLENVHGIKYSGKEEGFLALQKWTKLINRRHRVNYQLSWSVLNSADFGVPQQRNRFFLVGHRDGTVFQFPPPTHVPGSEREDEPLSTACLERYVTAWDAIGHLQDKTTHEGLEVKGRWGDLLPSIPEGENYLWHTHRKGGLPLFGWRTRYWSFLLKLSKRLPSWTIQAQPGSAIGPFHWKNRRLSTEEMVCIQTFPKGTRIAGGRASIQRQIGNAVPSLLTEVLGRAIAEQLFEMKVRGRLKRAVHTKRPIPRAEPIRRVPEKYHSYIGDHPDHPGEGRGRRARQERSAALEA